jgi:hypothetical protein
VEVIFSELIFNQLLLCITFAPKRRVVFCEFRLTTVNLNSFFYDHILEQQGSLVKGRIRLFLEQAKKEDIIKVLIQNDWSLNGLKM